MATAPVDPTPEGEEATRRLGLRRGRGFGGGGFSPSVSTSTETYQGEAPDLEPQPPSRPLAQRVAEESENLAPSGPQPEDDDNRRRLLEAAMAGDPAYAREFRLTLLNRLLMRGISLDNIARELGVSVSTVKNDRAELRKRMRAAARELDINELIGGQMAFYDEAAALSLRISSQRGMPTALRLAGVRTALSAKADQTRFLASAGVFDVLGFRRSETGQDISDVQVLMRLTEELISRVDEEETAVDSQPEPPTPTAPKLVRRTRPGSFTPMTFDDPGASNSSDEVVNL